MRARSLLPVTLVVVLCGMTGAQSPCDQTCTAFRNILAAAVGNFSTIRGNAVWTDDPKVSWFAGTVRIPGLEGIAGYPAACLIHLQTAPGDTHYECRGRIAVGGEQVLVERLRRGLLDAAPALCWNTIGDGFYVFSGPGCGGYSANVSVTRMGPTSEVMVLVYAGDFGDATRTGVLTIHGAPPDAKVELVSDPYANERRSGVTDSSGTLVLNDVRWGRYNVTITAMSRKPFKTMVDVEKEPVTVKAETAAAPLGEEEVTKMLRDGVSNERLKALVEKYGVVFNFDGEVEKRLRAAGANDSLLVTIARSKK